jgi:hypothetical protein
MLLHPMRWRTLAALLGLLAVTTARAEKPTKADVVKRGKAATELVELDSGGPGHRLLHSPLR